MSLFAGASSFLGRNASSPLFWAGATTFGVAALAVMPAMFFVGAIACLACLCDDNRYPTYPTQRVYVDRGPAYGSWWSMSNWFDGPSSWFNTSPGPVYSGLSSQQPSRPYTAPTSSSSWFDRRSQPYSAPTGHGSMFGGGQRVSAAPSLHVTTGSDAPTYSMGGQFVR